MAETEADALDVEIDDEGVVRLPGVDRGTVVVIDVSVLEFMLTEVYSAALSRNVGTCG